MKQEKIKKEKVLRFKVVLELADHTFETQGLNVISCLDKLQSKLKIQLKSKGTLTVSYGQLKSIRVMWPFEIKRLLLSDFNKAVFQKRMLSILK